MSIDIKNRVKEIINKRQKYIEKIAEQFLSDPLILGTVCISEKFENWLIEKKIIIEEIMEQKLIKEKTKRKGARYSTITTKTNEYKIITSTNFYKNRIRLTYSHHYNFIPYEDHGYHHEMLDLNSENWTTVKNVLDQIIKFIPIYINEYYEKEFNRLCPKTKNNICEHCGSLNDKCGKFCNNCGEKL